ncbi:hypothetical protein M758_1G218800 [Ceratodon purpureus]|nr:hypothetical protein M758_1G218800 [Ceratodon purpureus]
MLTPGRGPGRLQLPCQGSPLQSTLAKENLNSGAWLAKDGSNMLQQHHSCERFPASSLQIHKCTVLLTFAPATQLDTCSNSKIPISLLAKKLIHVLLAWPHKLNIRICYE